MRNGGSSSSLRLLAFSSRSYSRSSPEKTAFFPPTQELLSHLSPDSLPSTLQRYINSDNPSRGQKIHAHIIKTGLNPNTNISIKLLILHLKSGCLSYARAVFDEMPQRTLSAFNYMIGGCVKQRKVGESFELVRRMVPVGERPDGYTFSMILKASTQAQDVDLPYKVTGVVHAQILRLDTEPDDVLYTALVDSYVKHGKVGYARAVFNMMLEQNVICSTSMITGYMNQESFEDAEEIFRKTIEKDVVVFNAMIEGYSQSSEFAKRSLEIYIEMQRLEFRPNISTFASVIGSCSIMAAYEVGQQIQSQLVKTGLILDVKMGSALIDMYSKCGKVEDACSVFESMPNRNVFTWSSMIDGYGKNGDPHKALGLFSAMREQRIEPNSVTFLGALSACAHAGLVAKGHEIFLSMERDYSLKPGMEHYACMVDLLGRAGSLNRAWEFVMKMPEKPNSDVWAALLSSCRLHGDIEMASVAANELFKLNAEGRPGAYVALSNTLAHAGKWDSVTELRELMKARGISKDTACSCVEATYG
ncbi:hypothetical protein BT93_D2189 [Corymbia citriodora subsp. variegata]|nr:hypothetical protein BT93_D2189 [Corymbia citriodora subsp. variegata]KAF8033510.1 hypothetical protein BT93_D2189 [Corymbia citriodora subsp. variegata]